MSLYVPVYHADNDVPEVDYRPATPAEIKSAFLDLFRCTTHCVHDIQGEHGGTDLLVPCPGLPCPDCVDGWKLDDELGDTFIDWRTMSPRDQWQRILDMLEALEAE